MKSKLLTKILTSCVVLLLITGTTVNAKMMKKPGCIEKKGITIDYYGHSSFGISNSEGLQIVTDPYDPEMGFNFPSISTNILTVSHDHFDHNYIAALQGYKQLINTTTGSFKNGDIKIKGIASWHDPEQGALRGPNTIYTYEINNIKVCHLGDLGETLTPEEIRGIGKVDVLMIPVGGCFTIDSEEAVKAINTLNPKVVIPMHYATENSALKDYLAPVDDFTSKAKLQGWKVQNVDNLTLTKQMINTMKSRMVFVLNYN